MKSSQIIASILRDKNIKEFEGKVSITDIVACQYAGKVPPKGEFDFTNKNLATESEEDLIQRMINYIYELGSWAAKQHINDNFHQSTLLESKLNHITRLSLHEFALYPCKNRGPLSKKGFQEFLTELEIVTQNYPDNLHLFLGSVAVKTIDNRIESIGIYIECGKINHGVHVFTKAIPSHLDPVYPGTENSIFRSDVISPLLIHQLENSLAKLVTSFINKKDIDILKTQTEKVIKHLKAIQSPLCADLLKKTLDWQLRLRKASTFPAHLDNAIREIADLYNKFTDANSKQVRSLTRTITPTALADNPDIGAIHRGGNFVCTTAGHQKFRISAELCLDHEFEIGKNIIKSEIHSAETHSEHFLATHVSSLLSSNIHELNQTHLAGETYVHVDPKYSFNQASVGNNHSALTPKKAFQLSNLHFSHPTDVYVYPPQNVGKHAPELQKRIIKTNEQVLTKRAEKLLQATSALYSIETPTSQKNENSHNASYTGSYQTKDASTAALPADQTDEESIQSSPANIKIPDLSLTNSFLLFFTLGKFASKFLPSSSANTARIINEKDIELLENHANQLNVLGSQLNTKQQSIVFKMGLNNDNFARAARLYTKAKEMLTRILKTNKTTTSTLDEMTRIISELNLLIPQLTNADLRKQVRNLNLFAARKAGIHSKHERRMRLGKN